jgi:hypothetical protein
MGRDALIEDLRFAAANDFFVKPYAIGPVVDVNLPRGISAEVGFLV